MLEQFPFRILGFHSDNGSEFINTTVAKLLGTLLIEQTKSRPRQSNDNGFGGNQKWRRDSQTHGLQPYSGRPCRAHPAVL